MAQRFNFPIEQVFSNLGAIGDGYKLYTYETGTTTPLATYSDTALSSANANPTIADSTGRFGAIFVNDLRLYKAVLKDADDNTIWTADPVDPKVFSLSDFDPRPTSFWGATAGTASAYTLDADPDVIAYSSTQTFYFEAHLDSNADATMAVDGLPALTLKKYDGTGSKVNLEAGDLQSGQTYSARNDGTDIIILLTDPATTTRKGISYLNKPVTIANNTDDADHDMDFGAGNFDFDDDSGQATLSALTKQFDATFALGTDAGGMVNGESLPTSGYVYLYAISNAGGTITDIIGTTTADGSTISSDPVVTFNSLTKKKYLGSFLTDASANIDQSFFNVATKHGQVARYTTGAHASGATAIPFDDTIPQNTEGTQFMAIQFKPISATSKLIIDVCITLGSGSAGQTLTALFRDSTADALASAGSPLYSGPLITTYNFSKEVTSGSTSATTFKVRASITTGTVQFNGHSSGRRFGGTIPSSITITEIL